MRKYSLVIILLFALAHVTLCAQVPPAYAARLQFVLDSISNAYNIKGVSAAVVIPGAGNWTGTHGESHAGVPINSSMVLGLGSNTKTYVASLILKMEEQNLLSVNDTIGSWIQHPNVNGQITIRQLLNHTSGVFSYTGSQKWEDSLVADFTRVWIPDSITQFIEAPDFAPGAGWNYSNSNYLLLGLIIKQVLNQPLSAALKGNILSPAGLNNTYIYPEENVTAAIPHAWSDILNPGPAMQDLIAVHNYSHNAMFSMAWAAGAIVSTAEDNALFWSKLIQGQIVTPASLVKMKTTVTLSSTVSYGLGIFKYKNFNGRTIYSHGGTNIGFINENLADSVSGVGISVLTNQDSIDNNILLGELVAALHKVTINPPLAVKDIASADHNLVTYPNPARGSFSIAGMTEGKAAALSIYDFTGRQVLTRQISSYRNIQLPVLSDGMYTVKLATSDGHVFMTGMSVAQERL
jgi:D-alanyl-D-alanine carboxypeptidase